MALRKEKRQQVLNSFQKAEKRKKPNLDAMFTDVYETMPKHLILQQQELARLIKKYPEAYDTSSFSNS